jgi:hypothetical protein
MAKIIYYGTETEGLTVPFGRETILRFDEEVKTISQASKFQIQPTDTQEPNYRLLSITPRFETGTDQVIFILANDAVVTMKIDTVNADSPEKTDSFYDLQAKATKVDPVTPSTEGADVTELELMKAMIRSDDIVGYKAHALIQKVNSGVEGVSAQLLKVYTGPKFNGYIFSVENISKDKSYAIDLKSLTLGRPNMALLSQADASILAPKDKTKKPNSTFLRIVAKPSSVYHAVTLPIAPIQQQN